MCSINLLMFKVFLQLKELLKKRRNGQTVYDECGKKCKCEYGKLVKCCRLRKEFTDMTYAGRICYINTVKTASTNPAYKPKYDTQLTLHKTIFFDFGIPNRDFFLPCHRCFILKLHGKSFKTNRLSHQLSLLGMKFGGSEWSPFSSPVWNTGNDAFGGNRVPGGSCVKTGPFQ